MLVSMIQAMWRRCWQTHRPLLLLVPHLMIMNQALRLLNDASAGATPGIHTPLLCRHTPDMCMCVGPHTPGMCVCACVGPRTPGMCNVYTRYVCVCTCVSPHTPGMCVCACVGPRTPGMCNVYTRYVCVCTCVGPRTPGMCNVYVHVCRITVLLLVACDSTTTYCTAVSWK